MERVGGKITFVDRNMHLPHAPTASTPYGTIAWLCRPSPGGDHPNEDAAAVVEHEGGVVLIVADGFGGHPEGDKASGIAVEVVAETVAGASVSDRSSLRVPILDGFERANQAVYDLRVGAATTLAVVELSADSARAYHAGDSEILITGQRGKLRFRSVSHGPVAAAVEAGLIEAKDAMFHEARHIVTNHIGLEELRIEIGPIVSLRQRDTVLVASDGVFDNLSPDEIVDCIRAGSLDECALWLAERTAKRMTDPAGGEPSKPDDTTFILYRPTS